MKRRIPAVIAAIFVMNLMTVAAAALAAAAAGKGLKGAKAVDKGEAIAKTLNVVRKPLAKNESKQFKATAKGIKKASKGKADKAVEVAKGGKTGKGTLYTVDTGDFSYNADGTSNKLGGWIMKKSDIEGLTSVQIADKYALPKEPTHICDINLDSEFSLQTGISNSVKEWGKGGGQQFDTMGKIFDEAAFVNEKLIGE